jgi:HAMP domain-containing protein
VIAWLRAREIVGLVTEHVAQGNTTMAARDLADAAKHVAAGDYSQRLSVVQDDDRAALAASCSGRLAIRGLVHPLTRGELRHRHRRVGCCR